MAVFEGDSDLLVEADGIRQVPAVRNLVVWDVFFMDDRASERVSILLHAPALTEVVLAAGTVHGRWPRVIVDEDHVIAFAPPGALKVRNGMVAADVGASAFGLKDDVVVFAIKVRDLRFETVGLDLLRCPTVSGVFAAPMGMEVEGVFAK